MIISDKLSLKSLNDHIRLITIYQYHENLNASFVSFILVLPKDGPKITGGKDRYSVGDTVNVNCTSKASKPAADIQWIINGKAVS